MGCIMGKLFYEGLQKNEGQPGVKPTPIVVFSDHCYGSLGLMGGKGSDQARLLLTF